MPKHTVFVKEPTRPEPIRNKQESALGDIPLARLMAMYKSASIGSKVRKPAFHR